jgi:hypothetical protein
MGEKYSSTKGKFERERVIADMIAYSTEYERFSGFSNVCQGPTSILANPTRHAP